MSEMALFTSPRTVFIYCLEATADQNPTAAQIYSAHVSPHYVTMTYVVLHTVRFKRELTHASMSEMALFTYCTVFTFTASSHG